jgi:GcrA cell cycle regulator
MSRASSWDWVRRTEMTKNPFDLTFEELANASRDAAKAACEEARRSGIAVARVSRPPSPELKLHWSDERVAALLRMWLDGLSARQIAQQLGGVTPNAITKKAHRLGLSGRAPPAPRTPEVNASPGTSTQTVRVAPFVELPGTATVLTLGAHMCKWPIGDPSSNNFTFCGRRTDEESPYCSDHSRLAYGVQKGQASRVSDLNIVLLHPSATLRRA